MAAKVKRFTSSPKLLSKLEETLALQIRCEGLPEPVREYRALPDRDYRWDFAWPEHKLLVEVQGGIFRRSGKGAHTGGMSQVRDCEKQALATIAGWRAIAVTEKQINNLQAIAWIKQLLR